MTTEQTTTETVETPPVETPVETPPVETPPVETATPPDEGTPPEPTPPETPPVERVVPPADGYKLPEGMPTEMGEFANKHEFTQEQLDATINRFGEMLGASTEANIKAINDLGLAHVETWGENKDYNLNIAKQALAQNDPEGKLKALLNETGFGSHPAVLDFFLTVGNSMKEGGFLKSTVRTPPSQKTAAQVMYPDHPSEADN